MQVFVALTFNEPLIANHDVSGGWHATLVARSALVYIVGTSSVNRAQSSFNNSKIPKKNYHCIISASWKLSVASQALQGW